ncbi:MAG: hypothetical protein GY719_04740 [bacterium]|nr:hypothetical protein [bacterium]
MMLHIERDCPPPGVTPLDDSRDFHGWWRIFHIYRWILLSPTMATRRARTVLDELLELSDDELTVYRLNRLGDRKLTPEMRNLVKSENHGDLVSPDVSNHQGRPSCEERP